MRLSPLLRCLGSLLAGAWLAAAAGGCARGGPEDSGSPATPPQANATPLSAEPSAPLSVDVVSVQIGMDARSLLTSFLEPLLDAPVVARHSGIVRTVAALEGQMVAEGAVLATLEDDEQRLAWRRAEALATQAAAEAERARQLRERAVLSQQDVELAVSKSEVARAEADLAKLEFDRCTLRAPVAGVVRFVRAEPHRVVEEGEELFRVADVSRLRASFYLPPVLCAQLGSGQRVRVKAGAEGEAGSSEARVRTVNPVADPVTGLHHVEVLVSRGGGLSAGQDVRLLLPAEAGAEPTGLSGAMLPRGAYLERQGDRLFVHRTEGNRLRRVEVVLGPLGPDGFPILSGLAAGDLVLASGQSPPPEGTAVTARVLGP